VVGAPARDTIARNPPTNQTRCKVGFPKQNKKEKKRKEISFQKIRFNYKGSFCRKKNYFAFKSILKFSKNKRVKSKIFNE